MNNALAPQDGPQEEVAALVQHLHATHRRLQELAGGELDAVLLPSGQSHLLPEAQENLRLSEIAQRGFSATQSSILNALPAHIALLDHEGVILSVNNGWQQFASNNAFDTFSCGVGLNYLEICAGARGKSAAEAHQASAGIRAVLAGAVENFSLDYPCHSATAQRWFQLRVNPLEKDGPRGAVVMHVDITESKRAEEELHRQQNELRVLFDLVPAMIWFKDTQNAFLRVNRSAAATTGLRIEEIEGKSAYQLFPKQADGYYADDLEVIRSGVPKMGIVEKLPGAQGDERWVQTDKVPVCDAEGKVTGLIAMVHDITERKRIAENVERLAAIVESSDDAIISKTLDGIITSWNAGAEKMFGYTAAEIVGQPMQLLVPPDRPTEEAEILAGFVRGEMIRHFETVRVRKNGQILDVSATLSPIKDNSGRIVGASKILRDITERKRAEALLLESRQRLALATESAQIGIWDWNVVANEMVWDAQMYALYGIREEDFSGAYDAWQKGLHPEDRQRAEAEIAASLSGASDFDTEFRVLWPNGEVRDIEANAVVQRASDGSATRMIGVNRDITPRKRAEEKLHQSQGLLSMASRMGRLGAWVLDLLSGNLNWSEEVSEIHEMPPDYVPTVEAGIAFYAPEFRATIRDAVNACIRDGAPFDLELQIITGKGRLLWVRAIGEAGRDGAGAITRVQGAFQDIDERKEAALELASINRALKMLSTCNEVLIRAENERELLDKICRIVVETGGYRMAWVGFSQHDEARSITPQTHAGVEEGFLSEVQVTWNENEIRGQGPAGRCIRSGRAVVCDDLTLDPKFVHLHGPAKQRGYRSVISLPLRAGDRTFGLLGLYSAEINPAGAEELKLLQEMADDLAFGIINLRARVEQRRLHAVILKVAASVSAASGADFFVQLACNMTEALGAQAGFIGQQLSGEPLTARTLAAVVDGQVVENFDYVIAGTACANLLTSEAWVVEKDVAARHPSSPTLAAIGAQGYVGRRLESSSGQALGQLSVIFREPLKDVEFISSTLQIFAARAASELERQQTEAQVREQAALLDIAHEAIHVEDLDGRIIYWNKGAERIYGWVAPEAMGRKFTEMVQQDPVRFHEARSVLKDGGEWQGETIKRTKDDREILVEASWTLVRNASNEPKSVLVIDTDITERKRLEEQSFRAQRLESVGTLASGLAHDLNNILAPILMCTPLLRRGLEDGQRETFVATIEASAARGAQIIKQVLTFGRGIEGERHPLQIGPIVEEVMQIARETFPKNIHLERRIAGDLSEIIGDVTQWHQVILNLAINARDAMPEGGVLRITAENLAVDKHYASMIQDLTLGPHVVIEVTDTGSGISPKIAERIFDPFFTTKLPGKGTGLGLSSVLGIVKSHGAVIKLTSQLGSGSTFRIFIPASVAPPEKPVQQGGEDPANGNGKTVLIVDDEENIRKAARSVLEMHGYRILLAADGTEGLAIFAQNATTIDAVLTDITMPFLDGVGLIRALQRMKPGLPVIVSTGQAESTRQAELKELGVESVLKKPYTIQLLLQAIETALKGGAGKVA